MVYVVLSGFFLFPLSMGQIHQLFHWSGTALGLQGMWEAWLLKSSIFLFHYTHQVTGPRQEEFSLTAEPVHLSFVPDSWAGRAGTVMDWSGNIAVGCECKLLRCHHYPRDSVILPWFVSEILTGILLLINGQRRISLSAKCRLKEYRSLFMIFLSTKDFTLSCNFVSIGIAWFCFK